MNARQLRDATSAAAALQSLWSSLLTDGAELDAAIIRHAMIALNGVIGRISVGRVGLPVESEEAVS